MPPRWPRQNHGIFISSTAGNLSKRPVLPRSKSRQFSSDVFYSQPPSEATATIQSVKVSAALLCRSHWLYEQVCLRPPSLPPIQINQSKVNSVRVHSRTIAYRNYPSNAHVAVGVCSFSSSPLQNDCWRFKFELNWCRWRHQLWWLIVAALDKCRYFQRVERPLTRDAVL